MEQAIVAAEQGVQLRLQVRPGMAKPRFPAGFDPWRGRTGIHVTAPPQEGAANEEALAIVAKCLKVGRRAVHLVRGHKDPRKDVLVEGLTVSQALRLLEVP